MKAEINGTNYDTDAADLLATCNFEGGIIDQLYFDYTNEFFLCGGSCNQIRPISFTLAKYWAERFAGHEVYQKVLRLHYVYMR